MAANGNKLMMKVQVSVDPSDELANRHRCPIAGSILVGDQDTVHVNVDRDFIKFSRRSDGMRYVFATTDDAKEFIDSLDPLIDKEDITEEDWPAPFTLRLRSKDMISMSRRTSGSTTPRKRTGAVAAKTITKKVTSTSPTPAKPAAKFPKAKKSRARRPVFKASVA